MAIMKAMAKPMARDGKAAREVKANPGHVTGTFSKNDSKGPGIAAPWLKPGAGKAPKMC
ncbi:hypothetical protein [Hyphomicrobium sp.]|uniref:hypothetical protein n=1 Tax=Hyphomicrobium sp. TaxID=82 RepID=UPI001E06A315|nr:hypothetical protein [Hyphomicrobium sp.]MBY0562439.1 hypothetical protein [Hyphomicrobium sp.]